MIKLLIAGALAFAGYLLWRRWLAAGQAGYIDTYPYQRQLDRRLAGRRPELDATQRREVFAALVDYFQICRKAGRRMVAMPSQAVDDAWHEFILFTRYYDTFCRRAFGRFLHHTPAEAMTTPTQASDGLRRAWRLACAHEGIDPRHPERLPRLFALDARLGIAGGFVYRLDCMAVGPAGKSADAYCASHIGCSSGCGGGGSGCGGDAGSSSDGGSGSDGGGDGGGCGGGGD